MKPDPAVKAWEEDVTIPTYGIGQPEKNPVFLEKRVYQGSSGAVYPLPVIEKILDEKKDKTYHACFLENEYLKIMILPELGGRVQMAFDKIRQRHFIYHQDVIKPALVGLTGPWISGGIEFNWPQHHRPSTFDPVDFSIEENPDGSKTVWCNEVERMTRTKGMAGFTLYPGVAYLEIKARLYNRTPFPQTFLWWANPAVHVNDHYQSVFPPDVHAVFDHGRRDVSAFPIATGTYYKVDYSAGVDISRYKNIPVPTSYMAVQSKYDFLGGYEHDTHGGLLHVANHHISPGKKQWTWGTADFGRAWDRNLTDTNGPYVELMCGVFTDNQPDFSWIMPFEERVFEEYFMPYRDLGIVKNASKDAAVSMEIEERTIAVKIGVTRRYGNALVELKDADRVLFREQCDLSPEETFTRNADRGRDGAPEELIIAVVSEEGRTLVSWRPEKEEPQSIPEPAKPAKRPQEIAHNEQLYLTGLHLEQYRHATYDPLDYYREALRRDPGDVRCNNAMGLWLLRRGQAGKAEPYFRIAIETLTERNPNPYDGEPLYNLGCCLTMLGRLDEAYGAFYKSIWNAPWQGPGYFSLAQIAARKGWFGEALDHAERALLRNWHNHKSRHLKSILLRRLGRKEEALAWVDESLRIDGFNVGCLFERFLLSRDRESSEAAVARERLLQVTRKDVHTHIEYALDYAGAGQFSEASELLSWCLDGAAHPYPMACYFLGYFASQSGDRSKARDYYVQAAHARADCCFPNRLEEIAALLDAQAVNPDDAKAPYYLGNLWYAFRQYDDAVECWERSVALGDTFPTVWRNLSLAYYNKRQDPEKAREAMEKAFALDNTDGRVLMELDQLYKKLGRDPESRLAFLEEHLSTVEQRDDLFLEMVTLHNRLGQHETARELLAGRRFHPWEGGEGKATGQYVLCHLELARKALAARRYQEAIELLTQAQTHPENLGEGKLHGAQENHIHYYLGCAYEGIGKGEDAARHFRNASVGLTEPVQAFFYNDQSPDTIFYQGLALRRLGDEQEARARFQRLIQFGEQHLEDNITLDYFAVSLPDLLIWEDDLNLRNRIHCRYLMALGLLGLGKGAESVPLFEEVLAMDVNHPGAAMHLRDALSEQAPVE